MVREPKPCLSVCSSVAVSQRKKHCERDQFKNMRLDFFRSNVTVVFKELAAFRAKVAGLFQVPIDVFSIIPFTDFGLTVCLSCSR